jgi:hypothetical protein
MPAKIEVGKLIDLSNAVTKGLDQAAASPAITLQPQDVKPTENVVTQKAEAAVVKQLQPTIDHLTNQEPFYQSRQWWAMVATIVVALMNLAGFAVPDEFKEQFITLATTISGAVISLVLFYNRYYAKKPLGS